MESYCLNNCSMNRLNIAFEDLIINNDTAISTLNAKKADVHYRLEYAPVGNTPIRPSVILCGKTPGRDTWEKYLRFQHEGHDPEDAAAQSVYSNMKDNIYRYLNHIGLFGWLEQENTYWRRPDKRVLWDAIFTDLESSRQCGIQLTQAVNCAILRGRKSDEPSKSAFMEINEQNPECFFNRFILSDKLKLVIFFDTPFDNVRFHQIDYWGRSVMGKKAIAMGVKVISITHPSGRNFKVYDHLAELLEMAQNPTTDERIRNAARLLEEATNIIKGLLKPKTISIGSNINGKWEEN